MASGFNSQIHDLSVRTLAYHTRCQELWTKPPPPPHYGAPFLFAYVWSSWTVAQRKELIVKAQEAVKQSIDQMLSASGSPRDASKMQLLLAACVPEIFQEELWSQLRPMAHLLATIWGRATKAARQAAVASRPKHTSSQMHFIDRLPWVWSSAPTLQLMEHTLQALHYRVFEAPSSSASSASSSEPKLTPEDNEGFQRDLLLSLRAFWMSYFGLQIFMALSDHFAATEEKLLREAREAEMIKQAASAAASDSAEAAAASSEKPNGYSKPIHSLKIEEIVEGQGGDKQSGVESAAASSSAAAASAAAAAAATATSSSSSSAAVAATPSTLLPVPARVYCACCHQSPLAAVLTAASQPALPSVAKTDRAQIADKPVVELKRCGRCKAVWYCSVLCQKRHFKTHKSVCHPSAPDAAAAVAEANTPAPAPEATPAAASVVAAADDSAAAAASKPSPDMSAID